MKAGWGTLCLFLLAFSLPRVGNASAIPRLTSIVPVGSTFGFNYSIDLPANERLDPTETATETCPGPVSTDIQCNPTGTFFTIYDIPGFVSASAPAGPDWSVTHQTTGITPSSIDGSFESAALTNVTFWYSGPLFYAGGISVTFGGFQIVSTVSDANPSGAFSSQDTEDNIDPNGPTVQGVGFVEVPASPQVAPAVPALSHAVLTILMLLLAGSGSYALSRRH